MWAGSGMYGRGLVDVGGDDVGVAWVRVGGVCVRVGGAWASVKPPHENCLLAAHHFAMLWASVANTIPACFWSLYNLVSDPDALRVVRQQLLDELKLSGVDFSTDADVSLSRELLDKLLYLGKALDQRLAASYTVVTHCCRLRELHPREPAPVLGLHEHPSGSGGLRSASEERALGERQEGRHHRSVPTESAPGPGGLRGPTGVTTEGR